LGGRNIVPNRKGLSCRRGQICLAGAHAATIGEEVFQILTSHFLSDWSVNQFIADWEMAYGKGAGMRERSL